MTANAFSLWSFLTIKVARLLDFSDGSADNLRELVALYLKQTTEQLEQLAVAAKEGSAPEVRRLLQPILEQLDAAPPPVRRAVRAVEALEWMACPAADQLLAALAAGGAEARLTREAAAAAQRRSAVR